MATYTITRALAEIKVIDSKISKIEFSSQSNDFAGVIQGNNKMVKGTMLSKEEFETNSKAKVDSLEGLYERRRNIKRLIAEANVKNNVAFNGKEYTLFELIEYKKSSAILLNKYNEALSSIKRATSICEKENANLDSKIQQDISEKQKTNSQNVAKDFETSYKNKMYEMYLSTLVCGISQNEIQEKIDEIENLIAEADMLLSERNSQITIEL